jgi:predicted AAA+ superfamily ATPase
MTSQPKQSIYSFLSIGQRGVGKTVFLAACYLESHQDTEQQRLLWFDCEDRDARRTIDNLLLYVAITGEYPPAT